MGIAATLGAVVGTSIFANGLMGSPPDQPARSNLMSSALAPVLGGAAVAGVGALISHMNPMAGRLTIAAGVGAMAIPSLIMFPFVNEPSLRDS
jgi:hypothetical protein